MTNAPAWYATGRLNVPMRPEDNDRLTRIRAELDLRVGKRHKLTDVVRIALECLERNLEQYTDESTHA